MLWSPTRGFMCDQDDCRRDQNDRRNDPNDPLGDKNDDRSDPNDRRCDLSDQNEQRYSLTYHRNTTPTQQNRNVKNSQRKSICDKYGMKCERKDTTQQLIAHRSSCDKQRLTTLLVVFILVSLAQPLDGDETGTLKDLSKLMMKERTLENVFQTPNHTTVVGNVGNSVTLPCAVNMELKYGVITWTRLETANNPLTLLTVGDSDYSTDTRISLQPQKRKDEWNLSLRGLKLSDSGVYECQTTTHPPQNIRIILEVKEAYAEIQGASERVLKSESTLVLVCQHKNATFTPQYTFWYHNDRMINYDTQEKVTVEETPKSSKLRLESVTVDQSGNYTCQPSNMRSDSVIVTVLAENKSPNALQDKTSNGNLPRPSFLSLYIIFLILNYAILCHKPYST